MGEEKEQKLKKRGADNEDLFGPKLQSILPG